MPQTLDQSVAVAAPADRVWELVSTSEGLSRWFVDSTIVPGPRPAGGSDGLADGTRVRGPDLVGRVVRRAGNGAGAAYVTAKHACLGLLRAAARDLAPEARVAAVAPGGVATTLTVDKQQPNFTGAITPHGGCLKAGAP